MCYAKPGPRCSAHAARELTRINILLRQLNTNENFSRLSASQKQQEKKKLRALYAKAEREFESTPLGMKYLEKKISGEEKSFYSPGKLHEKLKKGIQTRQRQLEDYHAAKKNNVINHVSPDVNNSFALLGLATSFSPLTSKREGWARTDEMFDNTSAFLLNASQRWMSNLDEEESLSLNWFTKKGSLLISIDTALNRDRKEMEKNYSQELGYHYTRLEELGGQDALERKKAFLASALAKAPRIRMPVIIYRGLSELNNFSFDKVKAGEIVEIPHACSGTINPSIAADFATGRTILEIRTKSFASPVNMSAEDTNESEVIIAQGSKFRVISKMKDVSYIHTNTFHSIYTEDKFDVIQLEEITP